MLIRTVTVDFSAKGGKIKPITGINSGPLSGGRLECDFSPEYSELAIPSVRVSDVEPPYGGGRLVDVHCIFPDMSLDERMEGSYCFCPTDKYLSAIKALGADIVLRLGESYDLCGIGVYNRPPLDAMKWARIAEHIISHYNRGWGAGMKLGIKQVEIWCEPDRKGGFAGDVTEYADFYTTVARHLKECFPKLRIGAYSCGGFAGLNHFDAPTEVKGYTEYLERFLSLIASPEREAPLDFLSWKCYAESPEELALHANYARSYINASPYKKAGSVISEFNTKESLAGGAFKRREYPSELAASLIIAQKSAVDAVYYSDGNPLSPKNCLFTLDGGVDHRRYASYEVMRAFGRLYRYSSMLDGSEDYRREIYTLAAGAEGGATVILTTRDFSGEIDVVLESCPFSRYSITGLVGGGERGEGRMTSAQCVPLRDGKISLRAGKGEVYIIDLAP